MESIRDNYLRIIGRIEEVCLRSGRNPKEVQLVVVTKHQPVEKILQVWQAGARQFGENYPEETDQKVKWIDGNISPEWHMIGHIQSRKVKYLVEHFSYIHSIDRLEIAEKLNQACKAAGKKLPILIEVNISSETSKFGYAVQEESQLEKLIYDIEQMKALSHLQLSGLMTMPPLVNPNEMNRLIFRRCKELLMQLQKKTDLPTFKYLSMGTSQDFEIAIEEGATHIRIGEAIMGKRNLNLNH